MTHVILDCDGVLLDWETTFAMWMATTHNKVLDLQGPRTWDLCDWLGCDQKMAAAYVRAFNHSDEFAYMDPCEHALRGVRHLVSAGHTLSVLTSCSSSIGVSLNRKANLTRHFGDVFDSVFCLALTESKAPMLATMPRGLWVEDNYANATHGLDSGHDVFMVKRRHNANMEQHSHSDVTWITDWAPVVLRAANYV